MIRTVLIYLILCSFIIGCTPVSAWQRGQLAQENMLLDTDPLESGLRQHLQFSKEAASGGYGVGGGGCGCN